MHILRKVHFPKQNTCFFVFALFLILKKYAKRGNCRHRILSESCIPFQVRGPSSFSNSIQFCPCNPNFQVWGFLFVMRLYRINTILLHMCIINIFVCIIIVSIPINISYIYILLLLYYYIYYCIYYVFILLCLLYIHVVFVVMLLYSCY